MTEMTSSIVIDKQSRIKDFIADVNSDDNSIKDSSGNYETTRKAFLEEPIEVLKTYGITIVPSDPKDKWLETEIKEIKNIINKIDNIQKFPPAIPIAIKELRGTKGKVAGIPSDDDDLLIS